MWQFDLQNASWTRLSPASDAELARQIDAGHWPPGRILHVAGVLRDAAESRYMVIYGGLALHDTWLYEIERRQWQRLTTSDEIVADQTAGAGPGVRHGAVAAVGAFAVQGQPAAEGMLVFGGSQIKPLTMFNDLWLFTLKNGWQQLAANQYGSTINTPVQDSGELVAKSGSSGVSSVNCVNSRNAHAHTNLLCETTDGQWRPSARSYHAASIINWGTPPEPALLMVGGSNCTGGCGTEEVLGRLHYLQAFFFSFFSLLDSVGRCELFSDVWVWQPSAQRWVQLRPQPALATR